MSNTNKSRGRGWSVNNNYFLQRRHGRGRGNWNANSVSNSKILTTTREPLEKPSCMNILVDLKLNEEIENWYKTLEKTLALCKST